MGTLYYCHGIVRVSATEDPVFHCSSLGRRRLLTPVLRVVLRIVTAPLHMGWAEDARLVCCRRISSSPPLGLVSYHDRGRGDRNMSRIWYAPLGHHTPLLPPLAGGRFIATMVSMSRTLARRVPNKTQGHMLWP
jgi:hypothetical protein